MSELQIFLMLVGGLLIGGLLARALSKGDRLSLFLWLFAGAVPGATMLVAAPMGYMYPLVALPMAIIGYRYWKNKGAPKYF